MQLHFTETDPNARRGLLCLQQYPQQDVEGFLEADHSRDLGDVTFETDETFSVKSMAPP